MIENYRIWADEVVVNLFASRKVRVEHFDKIPNGLTLNKEGKAVLLTEKIGVRGVIDEVLHLSDGTLAPLDYKYTKYDDYTFETHKVQSVLYALLIMENYQRPVKKGFICYSKNGNTVKELIYSEDDFCYAKNIVREIFNVILKGYYPKKTRWQNRCIDCCCRNI